MSRLDRATTRNAALARRVGLIIGGLCLAVLLGQAVALTQGRAVPVPVLGLALVFACLDALFAIGLVLVYRACRVINFAHGALGAVAGVLFLALYPSFGYVGSLLCALAVAAATTGAVEMLVVRRFAKSPRLVLTVATIGAGQLLTGLAFFVPGPVITLFRGQDAADEGLAAVGVPTSPLSSLRLDVFPVRFTGDHLLIVVVTVALMAALAASLRYTSVGVAVRGAAENDERASLLGINTKVLSTIVWVTAGVLSALGTTLVIPITGQASAGAGGLTTLLRALAAAVLGRMENLPVTVAASFGIAIVGQSVFWAFDDSSLLNPMLLAVILGTILVQRAKLARTDEGVASTWTATEEIRAVPKELAGVAVVGRGVRRVAVAIAVLALGFPWVMSPSQTFQGSLYLIFGIVVVSLVILTGWGGQISLGQMAFVAVGAVVSGAVSSRLGWPFLVALVLGCAAGSASAVLLGLPALRVRGLFLAVTTLSFSVVVSSVVLNDRYFGWLLPERPLERPKLLWISSEDERVFYYLCLVALIGAVVAAEGIRRSAPGRSLIAMRDNERGAQAFGINLVRVRLSTFALSGFLASFAGVLYGFHEHDIAAAAFSPDQSVQLFLMAVIGGLGSIRGALLGAAYLGAANIVIPLQAGRLLAGGIGVLFLLLLVPGGLGALAYRLRDAWLARVAARLRIVVPSLVGDFRVATGDYGRAPLAPEFEGASETAVEVPVVYRMPSSRIRLRGASQRRGARTGTGR